MSKETSYFSHDTNAKDDIKCVELIEQLGLEGYGIFWVLIETLRDQPDFSYPIKLLGALARRYLSSAEKFNTVVRNYDLFEITEDGYFFSLSLNKRMELIGEKHRKRVESGRKGGIATALLQHCSGTATAKKVKETKVKEKKEKENKEKEKKNVSFNPPTQKEISDYCNERGNVVDSLKFFDFYESKGWMVGKNKMKDWRAAVRTWERNDNKKGNVNSSIRKSVDKDIEIGSDEWKQQMSEIYGVPAHLISSPLGPVYE